VAVKAATYQPIAEPHIDDVSRSMGNGICRIFDRSYRHFGMGDHARMIAARNVVDFRLRTRGGILLNVGWYDLVGLAHVGRSQSQVSIPVFAES
jgi:hypothetical protein